MRVGFIGLGAMGRPMAANLLRGGHEVTVYARRAAASAPLVEQGAATAATPAELAAGCDAVFTMVTGTATWRRSCSAPAGSCTARGPAAW